jgi:hypothetical protein
VEEPSGDAFPCHAQQKRKENDANEFLKKFLKQGK